MEITRLLLESNGAHCSQVDTFAAEWPNGAKVTKKNCLRAAALYLDIDWAANKFLLSGSAWEAYWEGEDRAWKACKEANARASKAYWEKNAKASKAYKEANAREWKAYLKANARASKEYEKAKAMAFWNAAKLTTA